jgi:hypothetical protein
MLSMCWCGNSQRRSTPGRALPSGVALPCRPEIQYNSHTISELGKITTASICQATKDFLRAKLNKYIMSFSTDDLIPRPALQSVSCGSIFFGFSKG